jgi:uncharacterized membrane protein YphA (DoxX/SURF4 family)
LAAVFIFASWGKIVDPAAFAGTIANYQILPPVWVNPAALLLPWLELVCGLGLLSGLLVRGSAFIVVILLSIFAVALAYSAYRGLDIHCGCFASSSEVAPNLAKDLFRDLVLLAMAVWVLIRHWGFRRLKGDTV